MSTSDIFKSTWSDVSICHSELYSKLSNWMFALIVSYYTVSRLGVLNMISHLQVQHFLSGVGANHAFLMNVEPFKIPFMRFVSGHIPTNTEMSYQFTMKVTNHKAKLKRSTGGEHVCRHKKELF